MDNTERLRRNAESKAMAEHDREQWSKEDLEFLMVFFDDAKGDPDLEVEVAEALGRTIEACRQRFYDTRSGRKSFKKTTRTTTTTETVTEYIGHMDDPDDQWWSPDYYRRG